MTRASLFLLLSFAFAAQTFTAPKTWAAEDIGGATKIVRTVTGRLSGANSRLSRGDRVFRNQSLRAGSRSLGQFRFRDDTRLALNANSSVRLDRFVYAGSGAKTQLLMQAARGAFRFATGKMPSRAYKIVTPSSTIGVRGTLFDVYVGGRGQTIVTLLYGSVRACNRAGRCRTLRRRCESVRIERNGQIVGADRPDATILAGEPARRAIPFLVSQRRLGRSMRVPNRIAARCAAVAAPNREINNDGGEGGGGDGGGGSRSDIRLKRDIQAVGQTHDGLTLYRFKYTWSDKEWVGVMAQDVLKVMPQAVSTDQSGFYRVHYRMLGLKMQPYLQWRASAKRQAAAPKAP